MEATRGMARNVDPCPKCGSECYARLLNEAAGARLFEEQRFCQRCRCHLPTGGSPCLNGCDDDKKRGEFATRPRRKPEPPPEDRS